MIQKNLWDGPAQFQCSTQYAYTVAWSLGSSLWNSQGDCFEGNNIDLRVNTVTEI